MRTNQTRGRPRSEKSRRAILDAAAQLLTERGYAGITIEGVAAKAGVGKTTIYRWWSTKAHIYVDLYSELALQVVPPPDTGDFERDLVILVQGAFRLYRNTAAGLALAGIVAEAQSNAQVSAMLRKVFAPSRRRVIMNVLERGASRGQIAPGADIEIVGDLLVAATWSSLLIGTRPLTAQLAKHLVCAVLDGVERPRPRPSRVAGKAAGAVSTAARRRAGAQ